MKAPEGVPIQIGNYRTTLPVYKEDRRTSEQIVARLEARHAAVRDEVSVDTVAEVLRVAYGFACDAHELKLDQEKQDAELGDRLNDILAQVNEVLRTYAPQRGTTKEGG